jgi:hypothetical protein
MSLFEPAVTISILKNAPSQSANRKGFEADWGSAVSGNTKIICGTNFEAGRKASAIMGEE